MLAKMTSKNQITIPKKIINQMGKVKHFDVTLKNGNIVMKPIEFYETNLEQIRSKINKLGLEKDAIAEAIRWARQK